jgi:hypothetical protein
VTLQDVDDWQMDRVFNPMARYVDRLWAAYASWGLLAAMVMANVIEFGLALGTTMQWLAVATCGAILPKVAGVITSAAKRGRSNPFRPMLHTGRLLALLLVTVALVDLGVRWLAADGWAVRALQFAPNVPMWTLVCFLSCEDMPPPEPAALPQGAM